jgi:ankyrin repeat protein
MEAGANIEARGKDGSTALMLAAGWKQNPEVITTLMKAGAVITARQAEGAPRSYTPRGSTGTLMLSPPSWRPVQTRRRKTIGERQPSRMRKITKSLKVLTPIGSSAKRSIGRQLIAPYDRQQHVLSGLPHEVRRFIIKAAK